MRAGFLGQSVCSLGFGIATLQAPRLVMDRPLEEPRPGEEARPADEKREPGPPTSSVTNPPRPWVWSGNRC